MNDESYDKAHTNEKRPYLGYGRFYVFTERTSIVRLR